MSFGNINFKNLQRPDPPPIVGGNPTYYAPHPQNEGPWFGGDMPLPGGGRMPSPDGSNLFPYSFGQPPPPNTGQPWSPLPPGGFGLTGMGGYTGAPEGVPNEDYIGQPFCGLLLRCYTMKEIHPKLK